MALLLNFLCGGRGDLTHRTPSALPFKPASPLLLTLCLLLTACQPPSADDSINPENFLVKARIELPLSFGEAASILPRSLLSLSSTHFGQDAILTISTNH